MTFLGKPNQNNHIFWDGTKFTQGPENTFVNANTSISGDGHQQVFMPVYTIIGDDPGTVPFLSATDNAPAFNAILASQKGGKIRLINPCFKTKPNLTTITSPLTIEIEGELRYLINVGELEIGAEVNIIGTGKGFFGAGGSGSAVGATAAIRGYTNATGNVGQDPNLGGTTASFSGPFYTLDFQGFPANAITSAVFGQTMTITSGGDATLLGTWTILSNASEVDSSNSTCRAVKNSGGIPSSTPLFNNIAVTIGSNNYTNINTHDMGIGTSPRAMKITGLRNLDPTKAWKQYMLVTGAAQTDLNQFYRMYGALNSTTAYVPASLQFYNSTPLFHFPASPTFPDGNDGAITWQVSSASIRVLGSNATIKGMAFANCVGPGLVLDFNTASGGGTHVDHCSFIASSYAVPCMILDGTFEDWFTFCVFEGLFFPAVLINQSSWNGSQFAGLLHFTDCGFSTNGVLAQQTLPPAFAGIGLDIYFERIVYESGLTSFLKIDPRGTITSLIRLLDMTIADQPLSATTIAAGSNGQSLPQSTINVASTSAFRQFPTLPTSGSIQVTTSTGAQNVNYTGMTATSFTGCTGGTGTMSTGGAVASTVYIMDGVYQTEPGVIQNVKIYGESIFFGNGIFGPNVDKAGPRLIWDFEATSPTLLNPVAHEYVVHGFGKADVALTGQAASFAPTTTMGFQVPIPDPSTWSGLPVDTGANMLTVTFPSTLVGPNGVSNTGGAQKVPLLTATSTLSRILMVTHNVAPQVGDTIIAGVWAKMTNSVIAFPATYCVIAADVPNTSLDHLGNDRFIFDPMSGNRIGSGWTFNSIFSQVTTAGTSSSTIFYVGVDPANGTCAYYQPFFLYIPASANIPEVELLRWYRHMRTQMVGTATGNLGIDKNQALDWQGLVTLGTDGTSGHLVTNANTVAISGPSAPPIIKQTDNATNGATGQTLTVQAQNATGTTSTGANLNLTSGIGTTIDGYVNLQVGGATQLAITPSGLAGSSAPVAWSSTLINTTGGTTVLSSAQYQNPLIVLSGTLTSGATITFPNVAGFWFVSISGLTLSGNTLTFKSGSATSSAISTLTSTSQIFMIITRGGNTIDINQ
jgi:hypothetical protein